MSTVHSGTPVDMHAYYERERQVAGDPAHPKYFLPSFPAGARVLDVGCGGGWDRQQQGVASFVGVDIDPDAIAFRTARDPNDQCFVLSGEKLSERFQPGSFTFVMSRVAIPYMDIPVFAREVRRVLAPGGRLWLTGHDIHFLLHDLTQSVRRGNVKDVIYRLYVLVNGLSLHLFGTMFRFPLNRRRMESFQTEGALRRVLARNGFVNIQCSKVGPHFLVEAVRGPAVSS